MLQNSQGARGAWWASVAVLLCVAVPAAAVPPQVDDDIPVCQEERPAEALPAVQPASDADDERGASCTEPPYVRHANRTEAGKAITAPAWADFDPSRIEDFNGTFDLDIRSFASIPDYPMARLTSFTVLEVAYRNYPEGGFGNEGEVVVVRLNIDVAGNAISRRWLDIVLSEDSDWSSIWPDNGSGKLIDAAELPKPDDTPAGVNTRVVITRNLRGGINVGTNFATRLVGLPSGEWRPFRVRRGVISVSDAIEAKVVLSWYSPYRFVLPPVP